MTKDVHNDNFSSAKSIKPKISPITPQEVPRLQNYRPDLIIEIINDIISKDSSSRIEITKLDIEREWIKRHGDFDVNRDLKFGLYGMVNAYADAGWYTGFTLGGTLIIAYLPLH
jgi:hypothetical protein